MSDDPLETKGTGMKLSDLFGSDPDFAATPSDYEQGVKDERERILEILDNTHRLPSDSCGPWFISLILGDVEPVRPEPKFKKGGRVWSKKHKDGVHIVSAVERQDTQWEVRHVSGWDYESDLVLARPEPKFTVGDKVLIPDGREITITKRRWLAHPGQWQYDGRNETLLSFMRLESSLTLAPTIPIPKFKVGDRVRCGDAGHDVHTIKSIRPTRSTYWYSLHDNSSAREDCLTLAPLNVTTPPEPKFKVGDKVLIPNGENTAFTITKVQWSLGSLQWGYDGRDDALREAVTPLVLEAIVEGADAITFEHRDGCFSSDNCRCHEFVETLEEFLAVLREGSHE